MTLAELNTYFSLITQLSRTEELLRNLREAIAPRSSAPTGMPHGTDVRDKIGDLASEIIDMENRKKRIEEKISLHQQAVEDFIGGIDDGYLRTIFRLRFERGLSWKEVADTIGGGNTEWGVKKLCYRYFKN